MPEAAVRSGKVEFLQKDFIPLIKNIEPRAKGKWGVMDGRQMIEHMIEVFRIANGKLKIPLVTPVDRLDKFREFLFSDKQFRENTKNPLLGEAPSPVNYDTKESAIDELEKEISDFFLLFENNPFAETLNPIFGDLNFNGNIQLLHKHALHHLRQFGLIE